MAQTAATRVQADGDVIDYTPGSAVTAGDVVVLGGLPMVADRDIAASALGALSVNGVYRVPKDASVFVAGNQVYWNPAGTPVTGTASSGCATLGAGPLAQPNIYLMGFAVAGALTGASYVDVRLLGNSGVTGPFKVATVAALGSDQTDGAPISIGFTLVSAANGTKGILLPSAYVGAECWIKNNAGFALKVWPYVGDAVNALGANAYFNMPSLTSCRLVAYDATTWYSIPLLPS